MWLIVPNNRLRSFNNYLTLVVVGLSLYIVLLPFLPIFQLWYDGFRDSTGGTRYSGLLASQNGQNDNLKDAPRDNRLVLPSIHVDDPIVVGEDPSNVHRGIWHRPNTSTPDRGGNTVLVGHRFTYSTPAIFYHLDKVAIGDTFAIWWEGREYVYQVFDSKIVPATAIEIEDNTSEPIATLYTCTPIWTAQNRLVIQARLVNTDVLEEI